MELGVASDRTEGTSYDKEPGVRSVKMEKKEQMRSDNER